MNDTIAPAPASARLAGVTFRRVGKLHYYPADGLPLDVGAHVVARTERGLEYGEVKILRDVDGDAGDREAGGFRLVRVATDDDGAVAERRGAQAADALTLCQARADRLRLPMKVVEAEAGFEGTQITFYFVADARVDFRELVKELARELRMRVHLHQVGSRDHAKQLGGYGTCGRPLCCTTFLRDFAPVSMKMAKDQSLFLNPSKFSGVCGKLMCCLRYEHDTYLEARDRLPPLGGSVACPDGAKGTVTDVNYLRETVTVQIRDADGTRFVTHPAADLVIARACGDCGSAGGGCGSGGGAGCASGGCGVPATAGPMARTTSPPVITLEHRFRKNWQA